jgi:LDH2 family malate/lactate/ureidoglycolate dehydrogenase
MKIFIQRKVILRDRFSSQKIREFSVMVFQKLNYSREEAEQISDVIITSDLFGIESHGCHRLKLYTDGVASIGRIKQGKKPEILRETATSALIEGHEYMGQICSVMAADIAIEKARKTGIAYVAVRNSNHFGIAGYYAKKILDEHLLGIVMTNTEASMVPTGGKKSLLGTNPIAVGMYAEPYPFIFDAATTVVPRGKLEVYTKKSAPIPEGWAIDNRGQPSRDPQKIHACIIAKDFGGILPLGGNGETNGGHKGYGLGLIVEIMTGILAGGVTSDHVREVFSEDRCSHMFLAIDYGMFGDTRVIENQLSQYLEKLRNSPASGDKPVMTHGQKEMINYQNNLKNGIFLNEKTQQEIIAIAKQFDVNPDLYLVPVKE